MSGNQVVRDVKFRDRLRDQYGALCVEMEAAALMNEFSCLAIRGVCDYADKHKNDSWYPYAAVTASGYAKELLHHITSAEATKEKPLRDLVSTS